MGRGLFVSKKGIDKNMKDNIKRTYSKFRKIENKVSNYVFYAFIFFLAFIVVIYVLGFFGLLVMCSIISISFIILRYFTNKKREISNEEK